MSGDSGRNDGSGDFGSVGVGVVGVGCCVGVGVVGAVTVCCVRIQD